ncbi:MAG: EamA family transporter [Firmicutes bacterium]|nr:EamA family transporter [Bacillota bacterium]
MFYLILSILCSSMLAIGMRLSEGKIQSKMSMIAVNYVACLLVGICYTGVAGLVPKGEGIVPMLGMGVFNGMFYMFSLVLNQYNIPRNGVVLTSVFSKMGGLLIPLAISIAIFREDPTMLQLIGFIISMVAIILICQGGEKTSAAKLSIGGLFVLFASDGCAGIMAKVFQEMGNPLLADHFLFVTFGVALILCVIVILFKRERMGKSELFYGLLIGIPNFMQAKFQLLAMETIPAVIVYPMKSVGTIIVITLTGILLFREKLNKKQWIALAAILVSLVLLNV